MNTSGISPSFLGLSRSSRWVTHVLLTRSRLCPGASPGSSLHLHVLSTPPAFVLSQDQTLREVNFMERRRRAIWVHVHRGNTDPATIECFLSRPPDEVGGSGRIWTHIPVPRQGTVCACC